ncbi:MAG: DUF1553 domain-containing protein, partial [Phycisphaerae bacterium]|nr:DUF1553 domain-containing protein [Phycisphaerae bacterium]
PTREYCTIRRNATSTPLQALVLWNDEQYVEAARLLAQRTLEEAESDAERLALMFRRCTSREPDADEAALLLGGLAQFRERYRAADADAAALLSRGAAPRDADVPTAELAAWTMIASTVFNMYETTTQH